MCEGKEGSPGDWNVMSEGKRRLEVLAGTSPGPVQSSPPIHKGVVDFLLLATGPYGLSDIDVTGWMLMTMKMMIILVTTEVFTEC